MTQTLRKNLLPFISVLSLIGAALSIWQTRLFYVTRSGMGEMKSFCNIGQTFDCTAIEMSSYSELAPGFPLSAFAISAYLLIFVISLYGMSETMRRNSKQLLVALTSVALIFSLVYLVIMTTQIGKLCLICLAVDAINLVMFIAALRLPKAEDGRGAGSISLPRLVGTGFIALFIGFLFTQGLNPQAEMKKEDANDMVESVLTTQSVALTIPSDAPVIGNPNAPITMVKFSDYQCPACKMGANAIHPLFKRYPDQVKFVFINYPLDMACNPAIKSKMHPYACEAAAVAICATEQGKFQEAYENLFLNQEHLATGKIADLLSSVPGIDLAKLKACIDLPSTADKIKRDVEFGTSLKIQSTPTFYLDGKKVEGGLPTNLWVQIIDRILKK